MNLLIRLYKLILAAVGTFLLVHLIGLIGLFLAITFPIIYLVFKEKTPALHRKTTGHKFVLINMFLIALVSLLSIGIIRLEAHFLKRMGLIEPAKTAYFSIDKNADTYPVGQEFEMEIKISGIETPINTVRADISYDPLILEVVDINIEDSFADVFIQKQADNKRGYARVAGGLPNPGYSGANGTFAKIIFKGIDTGPANIEFLPTSLLLVNDGKGTNTLGQFASASYMITPASETQILSRSSVLGDETAINSPKLELYELSNSISGSEIVSDIIELEDNNTLIGINLISKIDKIIMGFWIKPLRR